MKICAVIAEFNPFHNGHKFLIEQIRKKGFTHIVAIMSGNFVQRGEPAIVSKRARTEIALKSGIDLIIEIPSIWSISTAEKYAYSGVFIANSLQCVESLVFGCEHNNINDLEKILDAITDVKFEHYLRIHLKTGVSFPKARELAIYDIADNDAIVEHIKHPNNILAIEYIKALKKIQSNITPISILRSDFSQNNEVPYYSASEIRKIIISNSKKYKHYVPKISFEMIEKEIAASNVPCYLENAEQAILYKFRSLSKNDILKLPDITEGLENKILDAVKNATNLNELLSGIKSKRYTMSRIKRILLCAFLGITKENQNMNVPYIKILGTNKMGLEILKKSKSSIPIVSSYKEIKKLDHRAISTFEHECHICDLYGFFSNKLGVCGKEQSFKIIKDGFY